MAGSSFRCRLHGVHEYSLCIAITISVEQDPAVEPDEQGDRRRITYLYQTSVDKAAPLHLHPVPDAPIKEDETKT